MLRGVADGAQGVLPSQLIREAITAGYVHADGDKIPEDRVQPASLDLRLGPRAFRLRCSFLPGAETVDRKMQDRVIDELDLRAARCSTPNRPYLIPLTEQLALPEGMRAKTNPKSSTGRLDVFTRVITDGSYRFDEIADGYDGPLYLEVVPLSFAVQVEEGPLAQPAPPDRSGVRRSTDTELLAEHPVSPLLFRGGQPVPRGGSGARRRPVPRASICAVTTAGTSGSAPSSTRRAWTCPRSGHTASIRPTGSG